jgi:hypothetical protein
MPCRPNPRSVTILVSARLNRCGSWFGVDVLPSHWRIRHGAAVAAVRRRRCALPARSGEVTAPQGGVPWRCFPSRTTRTTAGRSPSSPQVRGTGTCSGAYAALWHPVVRTCMEAGWAVTGAGRLTTNRNGYRLEAEFTQPAPLLPSDTPGAPLPLGYETLAAFWPVRNSSLTAAWRRRRSAAKTTRERARQMAAEEAAYRQWRRGRRLDRQRMLMAAYAWARRGNPHKPIRDQTPTGCGATWPNASTPSNVRCRLRHPCWTSSAGTRCWPSRSTGQNTATPTAVSPTPHATPSSPPWGSRPSVDQHSGLE